MSKLKLEDLKNQGFEVTKQDAQELHHKMNEISQRGGEGYNEVYSGDDTPASIDPDKSKNKNLQGLVDDLNKIIDEKDEYIGQLKARIDELQKNDIDDIDPEENLQGPENHGYESHEPAALKFSLPVKGEHHLTKKKRLADAGLKEITVTQDELDTIPELVAAGLKPGDIIEIPA